MPKCLCLSSLRSKLVGAAGLEPATLCLEGRCSIRLSYAPFVDNKRLPYCWPVLGAATVGDFVGTTFFVGSLFAVGMASTACRLASILT